MGPFWALGAGLTGWLWINGVTVTEEMRAASRHFTLTADRTIDGVDLPAGAEVTLDDYDRLESATLPSGIAVALDGSTWRGFIKFGHGQETDLSAPTRISVGDPVTDTAFDGVLCRAGQPVAFWGSRGVRSCTLAKDTPAQDDIADAERGTVTVRFVCASDRRLEFQPGVGKEVASCFLAAPVEVQHVPCAAGSEIEIVNARLISCTLSAVLNFNGLEIPAGSVLHLVDSPQRIGRFALPAIAPPLPAFGIELPAQSEVWLCRDRWAVDQVIVPSNAYVEIGGVKLTGTRNFDCGVFSFGTLFADTRIRGGPTGPDCLFRHQDGDPCMPAQAADASAHANRPQWLNYQEGDFVIRNYVFRSGETKVGQPVRSDHRARQQASYSFSSRSCFTSARPALRM